jgi:hypothetical protein
MKSVRTSRVRTVLLAAVAAFCLVTFGALPHSSAAAVSTPVSGGAASPTATFAPHHDAEIVARTQAPSGAAEWSALPDIDLGASGVSLTVAGLLLALLIHRRRTVARYRTGPAPARAPPLPA